MTLRKFLLKNVITIDIKRLKYILQRILRGWSDEDMWEYDMFVVRKIRPSLKAFVMIKKNGSGYPASLKNMEEWKDILTKIERAFDLYYEMEITGTKKHKSFESKIKAYKETEEGFALFGKFLRGMWD